MTSSDSSHSKRESELAGQTVVVIGGSSGIQVTRHAVTKMRPGGTLVFMTGTGARRPGVGLAIAAIFSVALSALMANTALTGATYDIDGGEQIVPGA
jgi:hypothetical protein